MLTTIAKPYTKSNCLHESASETSFHCQALRLKPLIYGSVNVAPYDQGSNVSANGMRNGMVPGATCGENNIHVIAIVGSMAS